jgi:hypothetical protein
MSVNVLIAFYSRSGSTEALARSIAAGANPPAQRYGCGARASWSMLR